MVARLPVAGTPRTVRRGGESGAVAVEFALIMPVLLMLVFGILEFGFMINRDMVVGNASRDGARTASLSGTRTDIESTITSELGAAGIPGARTTISICARPNGTASCTNMSTSGYAVAATAGSTAVITVTYQHALITPFISSILGSSVTLAQKTEMRVE